MQHVPIKVKKKEADKKFTMLNGFEMPEIPKASKEELALLDLCGKLIDFVKHAHIEHLNILSHAKHEALGCLYEELPALADSLSEIVLYKVRGKKDNTIPNCCCEFEETQTFVEKIEEVEKFAYESYKATDCPAVEAAIGNVCELLSVTKYKLARLY